MKKRRNRRRIGTKMKYELRVVDLSKKYFGDLIPKERMEQLHKEKYR